MGAGRVSPHFGKIDIERNEEEVLGAYALPNLRVWCPREALVVDAICGMTFVVQQCDVREPKVLVQLDA